MSCVPATGVEPVHPIAGDDPSVYCWRVLLVEVYSRIDYRRPVCGGQVGGSSRGVAYHSGCECRSEWASSGSLS